MKKLRSGAVIDLNLDPTVFSETGKVRPCVIVTNDTYNARVPVLQVTPLTAWSAKKAAIVTNVVIEPARANGLTKKSVADCLQTRLIELHVARLLARASDTGALVGTAGYVAPEQLRNEPVDVRSDLFQVGIVLFEMITGERAFAGRTIKERIECAAQGPPLLDHVTIPDRLKPILSKSLAYQPDQRYGTAAEFLTDLRDAVAAATAGLPDRVAILDFHSDTLGPDDQWLGFAMADGLAAHLARIPGLQLVPRSTVLARHAHFAGSDAEFGQSLGCRWLVSGTIQETKSGLGFQVRLIAAPTGRVAFEDQIVGTLQEIAAVQNRMVDFIAVFFNRTSPTSAEKKGANLEAYRCSIRGRQFLLRSHKGDHNEAQALFEKAVQLEPDCTAALAGLAAVHAMRFSFTTDANTLDIATDYAKRAIAADAELGEPHVWLGYVLSIQSDLLASYRQLHKAMELNNRAQIRSCSGC